MHRIAAPVVAVLFIVIFTARAPGQTTKPATDAKSGPATLEQQKTEADQSLPFPQVEARQALTSRLPETKLENVRLEDAINYLQDVSGANIHVNWRALETVNITRETPISVKVRGLPLRHLLRFVLAEADGQNLVTFYVDGTVIEVTTRDMADNRLITKVYPVEDLLLTIPDFDDAPQFQLQQNTQAGRGSGSSGQSLFGGQAGGQEEAGATRAQRGQELVELIMDTVQPDVWRENGGTASIRFFRGRIIVTAPRSVHEQIGGTVK
ncbi:MAG: hypothetical protein WBD40_07050 [Tepidisphaeraceae bacterium]